MLFGCASSLRFIVFIKTGVFLFFFNKQKLDFDTIKYKRMFLQMRVSLKLALLITSVCLILGCLVGIGLLAFLLLFGKKTKVETEIELGDTKPGEPETSFSPIQIQETETSVRKKKIKRVVKSKRKPPPPIRKSYPNIDLSRVESKYLNSLDSEPKFTDYLKRSNRSFLGYEPTHRHSNRRKHRYTTTTEVRY